MKNRSLDHAHYSKELPSQFPSVQTEAVDEKVKNHVCTAPPIKIPSFEI